jgi:hypothetical protein
MRNADPRWPPGLLSAGEEGFATAREKTESEVISECILIMILFIIIK